MGRIHVLSEDRCQPDRRRRGGGAACVGGEGDAGELARRRGDAHQDQRGGGREEADPDHRQRMRHGARRRHAGVRAARDFEDQERRRSAERGHAGISRGGAAVDCVGIAAAAGDAGGGRSGGTVVEINGGKIARVEEAGLPLGTSITVRDLFFNTPARKKFLKAESTELSHIASLVTHYALAHPEKHFELHSATNAMLVAPPVAGYSERVYQVFGKETLDQLIPVAARQALERVGLPAASAVAAQEKQRRRARRPSPKDPGEMRIHGFVSKPEIQKLNRNSIFVFVNGRLIRDRAGAARADRGVPEHHSADGVIRWCCCFWRCRRRRWM